MKKNNSTRHWQKNGSGTAASGFSNDRQMRIEFAKFLRSCRRLSFFHRGIGPNYNELAFGFSAGYRAGRSNKRPGV